MVIAYTIAVSDERVPKTTWTLMLRRQRQHPPMPGLGVFHAARVFNALSLLWVGSRFDDDARDLLGVTRGVQASNAWGQMLMFQPAVGVRNGRVRSRLQVGLCFDA